MSVELGVLVGIALAVVCAMVIILPLRTSRRSQEIDTSAQADLLARRESAFQVLRDLDSDFESGKLSEEDYRPMRVQSLAQAAEILAQLDAAKPPESQPELVTGTPATNGKLAEPARVVATARKRARKTETDKFCPQCGTARAADDQFCRKCGKPLT